MSGVKGENSIKLFGTDLKTMEASAVEIEREMRQVRGVKDPGIFRLVGQPNLLIKVDREASARYGLQVSDVNAVVQAAVGGQVVTQVYEGERLFDLVIRFLPEYRLAKRVKLPERYRMEWAGQYDQLKDEQKRLVKIVPFALIGGVIALVASHTHFSISAAAGVISTLGVAIIGKGVTDLLYGRFPLDEAWFAQSGRESCRRPNAADSHGHVLVPRSDYCRRPS